MSPAERDMLAAVAEVAGRPEQCPVSGVWCLDGVGAQSLSDLREVLPPGWAARRTDDGLQIYPCVSLVTEVTQDGERVSVRTDGDDASAVYVLHAAEVALASMDREYRWSAQELLYDRGDVLEDPRAEAARITHAIRLVVLGPRRGTAQA